MRLYAHRGAAIELPENTLPAFARAIDLGADALELDVHATCDGIVVVSHDPNGARMAGVPRAIRDVSYAEVAGWDAGHGFRDPAGERPHAGRGIRIPTLAQVVNQFAGVPLNIDLKAPVAELVVPLLAKLGASERTCLASFQVATLRKVRALGYPGPTSLARAEVIRLLLLPPWAQRGALAPAGGVAQLPMWLLQKGVVARCHALGLKVDCWTLNDPALVPRAAALGVDGIMTDDPGRIAKALRALTAS
jgi:glycerophosphoryl diester phosphodiesterase